MLAPKLLVDAEQMREDRDGIERLRGRSLIECPDVSATFLRPFLSYTTSATVTYSMNMEATCDWKADESTVPLSVGVSKVVTIGSQVASIGTTLRYYASAPDNGPDGMALRLTFTLSYSRG